MSMSNLVSDSKISAHNLSYSYSEKCILSDLSVDFPKGKVSVVIGPNGCGKSTLLNALSGLLKPQAGVVKLDNKPLLSQSLNARAKQLSLLPQKNTAPHGITVKELVARGRYAYQTWLRQWHEDDEYAVDQALVQTGLTDLADSSISTLSGGQLQRAWLGLVLAQQTPLLLLDEPTTFLDIGHQLEVLNVCKKLNEEQGRTIIMVLHDLNLAAKYAHHMVAMRDGFVISSGTPEEVYQPEILRQLFNINCTVMPDPGCGSPMIIPVS
ncbi:MAG: ABC transporter ATP-binding protein [Paraglaciecola sp.]|uniref:ABC transporter ATP-binding protein n=1 Tax=Paraglaciecola sp. TaxID=1920173 RepID=UPI003297ACA7